MIDARVRCRSTIRYGTTLTTRCLLPADHGHDLVDAHDVEHVGRGLEEFEYQRIVWYSGDRRERFSNRDDEYSWEETR